MMIGCCADMCLNKDGKIKVVRGFSKQSNNRGFSYICVHRPYAFFI